MVLPVRATTTSRDSPLLRLSAFLLGPRRLHLWSLMYRPRHRAAGTSAKPARRTGGAHDHELVQRLEADHPADKSVSCPSWRRTRSPAPPESAPRQAGAPASHGLGASHSKLVANLTINCLPRPARPKLVVSVVDVRVPPSLTNATTHGCAIARHVRAHLHLPQELPDLRHKLACTVRRLCRQWKPPNWRICRGGEVYSATG